MHVLMTTDTVGGVWTYAVELARSSRDHDVQFALATMGAPLSDGQRRQVASLENVRVFESVYKLEWMQDPWDDVHDAGQWLLELEQKVQPDVVHLNGYAHGALPWRAPVAMVAHSCVLSWWEAVKQESAPAEWDRYRRTCTQGLYAAAAVIAPSRFMLDAVHRHYGPLPNTTVIYNGRDRRAFISGGKEPFVLAAGRLWDQAKNLSAVDKAAAQLPWPTYIAGQDTCLDGNALALQHAVPLGTLDESQMANWMSRASVYALPARYEPFGLSILEAAMCGCALVIGDIPSLREIWANAAEFVDPEDMGALARVLNELISDLDRQSELARRARLRAIRFTSNRMAAHYAALYRMVSDARKVPAMTTPRGEPCAL